MKYMPDTSIVAYAINKRPESVLQKLTAFQPEDLCISAITLAELEYGVCSSSPPEQSQFTLTAFLSQLQVMPFGSEAAWDYGDIRHDLAKRRLLIGANDLLIAAHARSLGLTLATNNGRVFDRVDGLTVENWV